MRWLAGVALALLAWGCAEHSDRQLEGALGAAIAHAGEAHAPLRLADSTDFAWQRCHIFTPYTPVSTIERDLGFAWPGAKDTGIDYLDGIDLLVFVKDRQVVRWVALPHNLGYFARIEKHDGYGPAQAVFKVTPRGQHPTFWELTTAGR
jgi:hypothetical protein